jgi:F-box/WD-40 domain protein 7
MYSVIYQVWDLMTMQCLQTLSEHKGAVTSVLCWEDKLLSCSLDRTVKFWTLSSESENLQVKYTHAEEHVSTHSCFSCVIFLFVECCRLFAKYVQPFLHV